MSNDTAVQVFNFEGSEVSTVIMDGEPWWVLADVCRVLDVQNPTDVARRLDDGEVTRFNLGGLSGDAHIVNESGLYSVVLTSRKPEAQQHLLKRYIPQEIMRYVGQE